MSAQNSGGSFHPIDHCSVNSGSGEMTSYQTEANWTVRDEFASKAMQGICSHGDTWGLATSSKIASAAYELADAMLAERAK